MAKRKKVWTPAMRADFARRMKRARAAKHRPRRKRAARPRMIKRRARRRNPLHRGVLLILKRAGSPQLRFTGTKFADHGKAVFFRDMASAKAMGRALRAKYPVLRKWKMVAEGSSRPN